MEKDYKRLEIIEQKKKLVSFGAQLQGQEWYKEPLNEQLKYGLYCPSVL